MIKSELIRALMAKNSNISESDIATGVNHILEYMSEVLVKDGRIEIRGFGRFSLRYRGPRQAHNPRTKKSLTTGGKYVPYFKPGKELRDRINQARNKSYRGII
jgi:integration host factor subunit beta